MAERTKRPSDWTRLAEAEEYETLCKIRGRHAVPVRQPLVLVSQVYRSGGTLLSQLFDGHPEVHAHPHELRIGRPTSRHWIDLDLGAPDTWFDSMYEPYAGKHFRRGYSKLATGLPKGDGPHDVFPFLFLPRLQKQVFDECVAEWSPATERDVVDCYFTSYFNAWLDNQTLYHEPKRVVTAFAPELNLKKDSLGRFFESYPEGTHIAIVRNPRTWYASARKQKERDIDVERALKRWRKSALAALDARERWGDRVVIVAYEDLVEDTETTMGRIAEAIGITMSPELLEPTFNGRPIRANSSHRVEQHGVLKDRTKTDLDAATLEEVDFWARGLYEQVFAD